MQASSDNPEAETVQSHLVSFRQISSRDDIYSVSISPGECSSFSARSRRSRDQYESGCMEWAKSNNWNQASVRDVKQWKQFEYPGTTL